MCYIDNGLLILYCMGFAFTISLSLWPLLLQSGEECSLSQFLETNVKHLLIGVKSSLYSVFVTL